MLSRPSKRSRIRLQGAQIDALREHECVAHVLSELDAGRGGWILTMNLDHLRRFAGEPAYAALCAEADLVVADGMPLVWASRLQGTPLPERVAGSELLWSIAAAAAARGRSLFLLGGAPGAAEATARALRRRNPALRIAGVRSPEPGFETRAGEMAELVDALQSSNGDIVYVALGSPKQERLIQHVRHALPQAWWLGVGISFSYAGGLIPQAPVWMRRSGLEWLHRLACEPRRLARRYLVHGAFFAPALFARAVAMRIRCVGVAAWVRSIFA